MGAERPLARRRQSIILRRHPKTYAAPSITIVTRAEDVMSEISSNLQEADKSIPQGVQAATFTHALAVG
jgi:hypothetical protein